jgi:hypothetical protein
MIPGVGRAVWQSGASGGGTGRTADWSTYDGTNDTAWQQWVDDTSTAISSSIDVTATPMNAHGFGGGKGALVLTDGTVNKVGLFIADTDDATAGQFKLYGNHGNTGTMRGYGALILLTGTDNDGSLVTYSWSGDNLTGGSKISGLYKFYYQDSTYAPPHEGVAVTLSQNYPYTGDYNTYAGGLYSQGSNNWPASAKTNWLQIWAVNPHKTSVTQDFNGQFFTPYRIANTQNLIDSPSSALLDRDGNTIGDTSPTYNTTHVKLNSFFNNSGGTATANGITYQVGNMDNFLIPFTRTVGYPGYTTTPAGIHNVAFAYASTNLGRGDNAFDPSARVFKFVWVQKRFLHLEDQTVAPEWYYSSSVGHTERYSQYQTGWNPGRDVAEAKIREKMKAIQIGDSFIGLYGDCSSVTDIGNLYLTACSGTQENINDNITGFEGILADTNVEGASNGFSVYSTSGTGGLATQTDHASNNIAVSVVNGSDSTSTAYDPVSTSLFALDDQYFAVAWTTSTNVYASVFQIQPQTSAAPTISRIADAINLGTIPASSGTKRVSGMRINKGVGVITCGNYYRIIKTDAI